MTSATYCRQSLEHTLSPSMDITVSSNFERLLFDLYERDGAAIAQLMSDFDKGIADCTEAIRIKPSFAEAYYNRATELAKKYFDPDKDPDE